MMNDNGNVCVAEKVGHRYGSRRALDGVSFTASEGVVIGLVGANGSGKSTLLRILAGVQTPTTGTMRLFGEDLARSESVGHGLGAAIDGMALWPSWSVGKNLRYVAGLCGASAAEVERATALAGITSEMPTRLRKLSLGNRQKVLLAAAFIAGSRLVLLDEPMNGLDPQMRQRIREAIVQLVAQGRTVLLSSHDLHDVESICGELLVLDEGRLIFAGRTTDFAATSTMTILRLSEDVTDRAQQLLHQAGIHSSRDGSGAVVFSHEASAASRVLATAGISVSAAQARTATLEEKYHDRF